MRISAPEQAELEPGRTQVTMLYRGLLATQMSGALDGLIAAHNSGGAYFRNRTTPTDPNTSRQIVMRSALNAAYLNWLDLTPEQRAIWESYARSIERTNRIGAKRHNSGWNEFVRAFTFRTYAESQFSTGITTTLATIELPQPAQSAPYTAAINTSNTDFEFTYDSTEPWWADDQNVLLVELSGVRTAPGVISIKPYPPTRNFLSVAAGRRGARFRPRTATDDHAGRHTHAVPARVLAGTHQLAHPGARTHPVRSRDRTLNAMTRDQLRSFLRALLATFLAGMLLWLFHRIGVQVQMPTITHTPT